MTNRNGFTLIELMVVISIIGILAAIAIPQFTMYRARAGVSEGYVLFEDAKNNISQFYDRTGRMPKDNAQAGLAEPELIRGKQVERVTVTDGAVQVVFREDSVALDGGTKELWFYPVVARDNPTGPLLWIKNLHEVQPWMQPFHDIPELEKK